MPFIMRLFYSSQFEQAVPILRWAVLGILGRIISWPMGFIILAKSKSNMFFLTELVADSVNIVATMILYQVFGLQGAGIAFALLYVFHVCLMLYVSRRISDFRWDKLNIRTISIAVTAVLALFLNNFARISTSLRYVLGISIFLAITFDFLLKLRRVSGLKLARFWKR
jgi:PST family polysaccharide transporter